MPLTELQCKSVACPSEKKRLRLSDSGGLYLEVSPTGSKRWMWKYRFHGKEKLMALGSFPQVPPKQARLARDAAKLLKSTGQDPMAVRRMDKLRLNCGEGETVREVSLEWWAKQKRSWSDGHATRLKRQLENHLFRALGDQKLSSVTATELRLVLEGIQKSGRLETAERTLTLARQVWGYAIAAGRTKEDITRSLKGVLIPKRKRHHAAIIDPIELGRLLACINEYRGSTVVRAALQLAPMLFQRPGELRAATWEEMNLEEGLWTIPSARMKRRIEGKEYGDPHYVPLPQQAVSILRELKEVTGSRKHVFPCQRGNGKPLSDNSVRSALINMGYTPDLHTWHGFRATARTILAERLEVDPLLIEAQLAHAVRDANGRAYNRTQYLAQRRKMMQKWADYLQHLVQQAEPDRLAA